MTYESCIHNLDTLMTNLETSDVKFLFFFASKLDEPKVRTSLKRWHINDNEFYIMYGLDKANVYVYRKSELTVLVDAFDSFTEVITCNHVDFGIVRHRNRPDETMDKILIKSNYTSYSNLDIVPATRNEDHCNFIVKDQNFNDFDEFCKTACESTYGAKLGELHNVYPDPRDRLVVFSLCRAAFYGCVGGGGARANSVGAPLTYGGVSFMTDTFVRYVSENLIQPVEQLRPYDLISVKVFFDEGNELSHRGNRNIIVIYDFDRSSSNIFYIDTLMLLTACYAEEAVKNNPDVVLSPQEQTSLDSARRIFWMISETTALSDDT